ncbi:DUF1318 domain-containing protein [Sulfuriroseicoccus oceanibius]|uniref:DUF1318 domain-containing protein n=1 Tax=Sulfuriroseicoccus oceanibius TaxID=2707525 RepID=A0A6B3LAG0_9BACT|nr:DUF1318 domain-containing protein [Sulfuriroseicoccus oceanibius]QQL44951.1 DUF1318 domain-containing protein [Sulfuriroseicoccus oceanibius]
MKTTIKILMLAVVALVCVPSVLAVSDSALRDEFKLLNAERDKRAVLVDYLKKASVVEETADGTLKLSGDGDSHARAAVEEENRDRLRQFEIIARINGEPVAEVAKQFAMRMGVDVDAPEVRTLLRIHGSNTVGASLAPELVRQFLTSRGYQNISLQRDGVEATIRFSLPGERELGEVEIKAHGSSTAFGETSSSKSVGLAGGFCDIGMASRPIKEKEAINLAQLGIGDLRNPACEFPIALDGVAVVVNRNNPVSSLTVDQISKLFSGEIANWKELGGPDQPVFVYARDEQSGTWDTFKARVLKPFKRKLTTSNVDRFEDSEKLVRNVATHPNGIGFVGLAYVGASVKALRVQAGEQALPLEATRLTVKTQDYPLARLLYFYVPVNASPMALDFVKFTMSNDGQEVVDGTGLVGQGLSTKTDRENADSLKQQLLASEDVPYGYREAIRRADRRDTQANIRFSSGSDQPDINSLNNLERLAGLLASAGNENVSVVLIGFADNVGASENNLRISQRRAEAVADVLRAKGVRNIEVHGFGEAMPVADNASAAGRANNRRVEVWLVRG